MTDSASGSPDLFPPQFLKVPALFPAQAWNRFPSYGKKAGVDGGTNPDLFPAQGTKADVVEVEYLLRLLGPEKDSEDDALSPPP